MLKKTATTFLRLYEAKDADFAKECYYDHENATFFYDFGPVMRHEDFVSLANLGNAHMFVVYDDNSQVEVGLAMVYNIKWKARVASIGVMIKPEFRKMKHAMSATAIIIDFVINSLGIEKVICETLVVNDRVETELSKNGFVLEGTLFNEALFEGKRVNILRFCAFKEDLQKRLQNVWR